MIKAVLIDLDNTLILNPDDIFVQEYLALAEDFFGSSLGLATPRQTITDIMKHLQEARWGRETNFSLMASYLQSQSQKTLSQVIASMDTFFTTHYPSLAPLVQPIQDAVRLINQLKAQEISVVIATNPVYPQSAVIQRMVWGELPTESDYKLVTYANNSHFVKPDPAYYAEIVAKVGIEPDETLMIGDNEINDIKAARDMGLVTFHTPSPTAQNKNTLQSVLTLLQNPNWRAELKPTLLTPQAVLHEWRGNIGALHGMLENLSPSIWHLKPLANEWSIAQILTHLFYSECEAQRPRLETIFSQDNPFIASPKPQDHTLTPLNLDVMVIFNAFVQERLKTIRLLQSWTESAPSEVWQKTARHSIFGITNLLEMAHFTAQHDRLHINQLCQTIGRCQDN